MAGMLGQLGLSLEGRHHSGIDDCRNIWRIIQQLLEKGLDPHRAIQHRFRHEPWPQALELK